MHVKSEVFHLGICLLLKYFYFSIYPFHIFKKCLNVFYLANLIYERNMFANLIDIIND